MTTFSDILDEDLLIELAGDRFFERGVDYFENGQVQSLAEFEEHITAQVHGTSVYQVDLWLEADDLRYRCTCPVGTDGWFCKHCVAVALAWIDEPPPYQASGEASVQPGTTMADVRDYLNQQDRDTLVRMILDKAMEDASWREKLLMKAAFRGEGVDIGAFRRALRNAIAIGDFVDYYAASGYADDVQAVVDELEELLTAGYANDVVDLTEAAIELLEEALNAIDDSDGNLNEIIDQLPDLHYRACEIAHPDPRALAQRLFHHELSSGFGFFSGALTSYADILGQTGLETYQQLIDAEWQTLPAINSNHRSNYDYRRAKLSRMKEALVAATGNLDDLIQVIAKDLSQPSRYLRIAELYWEAERMEEAIAWAEKGLQEFQGNYLTGQLEDFLVRAYEQQERFEDA